jgi:glyoxylase-like metal-dependent hydrolase (beta-lactamase superfamily II)
MKTLYSAAVALALAPAALAPVAAATLDEVAAAMGVQKVDSLQFTASGKFYFVGQSQQAGSAWPVVDLVRLTRTMDFKSGSVRDDEVLAIGNNRFFGQGGIPITGERVRAYGITNNQAWMIAAPAPATASPGMMATLSHDVWTSPVGIVKAAIEDKAQMDGSSFTVERQGRFKARTTVNSQNLVEKVESWVGNPVLGDMAVVTTYADYKDFDGVKFPTRITRTAGGFPAIEATVSEVKVNAGAVAAPETIAPASNEVKVEKAADGVWHIAGGSHHSVAVEMADHVVLIEAPLGDGRVVPVIDAVKQTIPGKPIRAVVATHHHFDHSGGLRAAAAEDLTIISHESNQAYFKDAYAAPRTLAPDRLSRSGKTAKFEPVGDKLVLGDATRTLEIHHVKGNPHVVGLLIGYLPKEKIMVVADAFSPRAPITKTPERVNPNTANLWSNITELKLDVETVVPIHGRIVKVGELKLEAGASN